MLKPKLPSHWKIHHNLLNLDIFMILIELTNNLFVWRLFCEKLTHLKWLSSLTHFDHTTLLIILLKMSTKMTLFHDYSQQFKLYYNEKGTQFLLRHGRNHDRCGTNHQWLTTPWNFSYTQCTIAWKSIFFNELWWKFCRLDTIYFIFYMDDFASMRDVNLSIAFESNDP